MRALEHLINLIKYSPIAEKTLALKQIGIYTFVVDRSMTKLEINKAISNLFSVKVATVNISTMPVKIKKVGKFAGKKSQFKKAYIKLANSSEKLELGFPL
jgi:large subunit ribosomal protein L23